MITYVIVGFFNVFFKEVSIVVDENKVIVLTGEGPFITC